MKSLVRNAMQIQEKSLGYMPYRLYVNNKSYPVCETPWGRGVLWSKSGRYVRRRCEMGHFVRGILQKIIPCICEKKFVKKRTDCRDIVKYHTLCERKILFFPFLQITYWEGFCGKAYPWWEDNLKRGSFCRTYTYMPTLSTRVPLSRGATFLNFYLHSGPHSAHACRYVEFQF